MFRQSSMLLLAAMSQHFVDQSHQSKALNICLKIFHVRSWHLETSKLKKVKLTYIRAKHYII